MKKQKYILIAIAIIGIILSWSLPIASAETIIDLGTVQYMNSLQVDVDSNEQINLTFISSFMDENDIRITNYGFDPILNKTRFLFTSEHVNAEHWMKNINITYIYQDNTTKQLYSIQIDYSTLEIPPSPLEIDLIDLLDEYDIESNNDSKLINLTRNLLINIMYDLNQKNLSLSNRTEQFKQLTIDFYNLSDDYNFTSEELENITGFFTELNNSYNKLESDNKYNHSLAVEYGGNLSDYQDFFEKITISHQDKTWFKGKYYTTNYKYKQKIKKLEDETEIGSLFLIAGIILTAFFSFLIARVFIKKRNLSDEKIHDITGYPEEAKKIDEKTNTNPLQEKKLTEKILFFKKKKSADNQIREIEQKMDKKIENIDQKVDTLISGFDDFKTNLKDNLTDLVDNAISKKKSTIKK
jgi:hypothetical protein